MAPRTQFVFLKHHDCHAASAFLVSPFEQAGILTCDACGEWDTTVYYQGNGERISSLHGDQMPNSLGLVYGALTQYLGFQEKCDEGKVMALAAMAEPEYMQPMQGIFNLNGRGSLQLDTRYFNFHYNTKDKLYSPKLVDLLGPALTGEPSLRSRQIAASLQTQCEHVLKDMAGQLLSETQPNHMCLAGGVALNSKANGRLVEDQVVNRLFVQPAANDSGTALGAALLAHVEAGGPPLQRAPFDPYLGPQSSSEECRKEADAAGMICREVGHLSEVTAGLLDNGQVVGWHQGRMEWGPRALGNRSILADPRNASMKDHVNAKVKFREAFRPFAPAILREAQTEYFKCDHPVPYMTHVLTVRPEMTTRIAAAVHVDGTARLQTVDQNENAAFSDLIRAFYRRTNVPVVLNTSLNVQGMPIAVSPEKSLKCLRNTDLDYLVLGPMVICKTENKKALLEKVISELS